MIPVHAKKRSGWRDNPPTIILIASAPLVALALTSFVFQSYQVSGQSMEPTLRHQDRLLVWKLPRTWARITGHHYVPARGDIVIFTEAKIADFGRPEDEQLIKRVIALPDERVVVKNGAITVYNRQHPEGFRPDDLLPYGQTIPATIHDGETTVGAHELYVAGDNRLNSTDSRYLGPVQLKNIKGVLSWRVVPINEAGHF